MSEHCEVFSLKEPHGKARTPHNFELSLIYHLIDHFDIPDPIELFNEIAMSVSKCGYSHECGGQYIYFGGFKRFRSLLSHHLFYSHRVEMNMSVIDISIKYGVSARTVYRGIKCPGSNK